MASTQAERLTTRPSTEWHVFALGAWHVITYDGYAPATVEVRGRLFPVQYRHMGRDCHRPTCRR